MQKFFTFLKSRGEPQIGRGVWAILVYFENRRADLLNQYDIRVSNQKRLDLKREIEPVEKSHFTSVATSLRKFLRVAGLRKSSGF